MSLFELTYGHRSQEMRRQMELLTEQARSALTRPRRPICETSPEKIDRKELRAKLFEETLGRLHSDGIGSTSPVRNDNTHMAESEDPALRKDLKPQQLVSSRLVDEEWRETRALRIEVERRHCIAMTHEYGHPGRKCWRNSGRKPRNKYRPVVML